MNERLLSYIVDAGVIHLGDNPSRHSPIMMKLDVGNIPVMSRLSEKVPKRPAWYKADQDQLDEYTETLDAKLSAVQVPDSLQCLDPQCKDEEHSRERDNLHAQHSVSYH